LHAHRMMVHPRKVYLVRDIHGISQNLLSISILIEDWAPRRPRMDTASRLRNFALSPSLMSRFNSCRKGCLEGICLLVMAMGSWRILSLANDPSEDLSLFAHHICSWTPKSDNDDEEATPYWAVFLPSITHHHPYHPFR
jgi:hypothetical protein